MPTIADMRDFRYDGGFRAPVDNFVGDGDNYDDYSLNSADEQEILDSFVNNAPPRSSKSKKRKLSGDERLNRCRERNRIHARNTRERKKAQMDTLQLRVHALNDEKLRLKNILVESNVAEILVTLAQFSSPAAAAAAAAAPPPPAPSSSAHKFPNMALVKDPLSTATGAPIFGSASSHELCERIKIQVSRELSDDEELDIDLDTALMRKDKSDCTPSDLDRIRRERNRMHAKKTRLRKKKMLQELEQLVNHLEGEVQRLHRQVLIHRGGMSSEEIDMSQNSVIAGGYMSDDIEEEEEEEEEEENDDEGQMQMLDMVEAVREHFHENHKNLDNDSCGDGDGSTSQASESRNSGAASVVSTSTSSSVRTISIHEEAKMSSLIHSTHASSSGTTSRASGSVSGFSSGSGSGSGSGSSEDGETIERSGSLRKRSSTQQSSSASGKGSFLAVPAHKMEGGARRASTRQ